MRCGPHSRSNLRLAIRHTGAIAIATLLALGTLQLEVSSAAFTTTNSNSGNAASTLTVAPPTNGLATMTLNVVPLATCRVAVSWSASPTPDVTSYDVVRVLASNGSVIAGPWTVSGTSLIDNPVPLQVVGSEYAWRIRARLASWRSTWHPATAANQLACLI